MDIHVVRAGESLYSIAQEYGVTLSRLMADNQLPDPSVLATGQTIVVRRPSQVYTVQPGDILEDIAQAYGLTVDQLLRNNPNLRGETAIYPGQTLVLRYQGEKRGTLSANGYAYPFIDKGLLQQELPFLTNLTPFTYGITPTGGLVELDDQALIAAARQMGVAPLMHLSTLTEEGSFSNELASLVLNDAVIQNRLVQNVKTTLAQRGYRGLDVDFEFVFARDGDAYAAFIARLRQELHPLGYPVIVALAPKTSAQQAGLLYEGHNYRALGQAADQLLLMTYEWGYTYGPPMAVAPLPNVRQVVEYALTEIPAQKLWLGVPNYGYNWTLPFVQGQSKATSISNQYAVQLALRYGAVIQYDQTAQSPWFRYTDGQGREHEVWFEDARSIQAKLALIPEYGLYGVGYWNLMRPFPQNWIVLDSEYNIRRGE